MGEIRIIGELNGLGATLLPIMEQNVDNPDRMKKLRGITGSLTATEKSTGVTITIIFDKGAISLKDGPVEKPAASLWADFEMVEAYSSLANAGVKVTPYFILEVRDADGVLLESNVPRREMVLDERTAYIVADMMRGVIYSPNGTGKRADIGRPAAGKTGTADSNTDAWFVGFTPKDARRSAGDPDGFRAVRRNDSNLVFLAFAYDSRTRGNAATEIVKYFLQMHFKLHVDLREAWILQRDNFYGG